MIQNKTVKQVHNFKYFTGSHPKIRAHYLAGNRPTEFGNKVWATSLVLLNYLHERNFDLKNKRVLEIGCGQGLLGVYLAQEFDCQVTCSDLDPHVLPIAQLHAELNGVVIQTRVASFNDLKETDLKEFDLIIGAEVCYSEQVAQDIISLIKRSFASGVSHILIADPGRPDFDDCIEYCGRNSTSQIIDLPGTVNGKVTKLLSAMK
ncbi:MAG: class I SAM-dependent methyltransferase [Bacteriovoracaceae bacterium]|nr:class I SAM-dependent methyltransferase [Bacteriovoracaceae bacterium]